MNIDFIIGTIAGGVLGVLIGVFVSWVTVSIHERSEKKMTKGNHER